MTPVAPGNKPNWSCPVPPLSLPCGPGCCPGTAHSGRAGFFWTGPGFKFFFLDGPGFNFKANMSSLFFHPFSLSPFDLFLAYFSWISQNNIESAEANRLLPPYFLPQQALYLWRRGRPVATVFVLRKRRVTLGVGPPDTDGKPSGNGGCGLWGNQSVEGGRFVQPSM